jgi:hypothetical protein
MPKDVPWEGKTVFTGVFKDPVTGPCRVRKLNVDGDGQGDLAGHGGEQRAVASSGVFFTHIGWKRWDSKKAVGTGQSCGTGVGSPCGDARVVLKHVVDRCGRRVFRRPTSRCRIASSTSHTCIGAQAARPERAGERSQLAQAQPTDRKVGA